MKRFGKLLGRKRGAFSTSLSLCARPASGSYHFPFKHVNYTCIPYLHTYILYVLGMYEYAIVARSAPTPLRHPHHHLHLHIHSYICIWRRYGRARTVHDVCGGSFPFGPHGLSVSFPCLSTIPPASSGSRFTSRSAAPCYMEIILCLFEGVHVDSLAVVETVWPTYTQGLREHLLPNER